jgi:transposase
MSTKRTLWRVSCSQRQDGTVQRYLRTFSTMTADLLSCADWLESLFVEMVAMESTGVFWRPVFNLLEADFPVILVNAQHRKAVPGRKTDVKDSEWIADLLRHGLLKASFIPPQPIRDLRDLTRYRKTLTQEKAQEVNRLQKVLETANLKLASVASDVMSKSGRDMLDALVAGERDPEVLAELARGRIISEITPTAPSVGWSLTASSELSAPADPRSPRLLGAIFGVVGSRDRGASGPF